MGSFSVRCVFFLLVVMAVMIVVCKGNGKDNGKCVGECGVDTDCDDRDECDDDDDCDDWDDDVCEGMCPRVCLKRDR